MTILADSRLRRRWAISGAFRWLCRGITMFGVLMLGVLIYQVAEAGLPWLDWQFITSLPSRFPEKAGVKPAIWGTVWLVALTALISVSVGIAAALYLEEYAHKGRISTFIEVNISNLAGVPSVVYGILGLAVFVRWFALGHSVLAGALTMSLLILPVVITSSREAVRAVPDSLRHAALALGSTRWQMIRYHVIPAALPGILTGVILSLSRAIGETAPLILVGAAVYIGFTPDSPMSEFAVLPLQVYEWSGRPQSEFRELAAAGILVLLVVLVVMNASAVYLRHRFQKGRS